ncbi:MAG: allophanate hydrolase [Puniceicoccaceae bacterium]
MSKTHLPLTIPALRQAYHSGALTVRSLMQQLDEQYRTLADPALFIHWLQPDELEPYLRRLDTRSVADLPLYGVPFAIKDNIDLAGIPTTAACPAYAYTPTRSATVVQRLIDAGAIPVGKTNLDQFATGLVGVRSPYGVPRNPLAPDRIPGGSSSGSAVAVAQNLAVFSLGTDTAGSGRVPAAFNELMGVKPTRGLLSTVGVVPACRSLDCVSIFTTHLTDAQLLLDITMGPDTEDPFSRSMVSMDSNSGIPMRIGVPESEMLEFFGDAGYAAAFESYRSALAHRPDITLERIDFAPFREAAALLYQGPWIAERAAAVGEFIQANPEAVHPITREIILGGFRPSAVDTFQALYQLQALKRAANAELEGLDAILIPTAGGFPTLEAVAAEPISLNTQLGNYTNFMNLLDCAALAIPAGRTATGLPFGVTLFAPAGHDPKLITVAARLRGESIPADANTMSAPSTWLDLVVCGAHMRGLPLNHQLTRLDGTFVREVTSAPCYELYCLHHKDPIRPGMVRCSGGGATIQMEHWRLPIENVGRFLAEIQEPLGLGSVELADGTWMHGFTCDASVTTLPTTETITAHASWRQYLASR